MFKNGRGMGEGDSRKRAISGALVPVADGILYCES